MFNIQGTSSPTPSWLKNGVRIIRLLSNLRIITVNILMVLRVGGDSLISFLCPQQSIIMITVIISTYSARHQRDTLHVFSYLNNHNAVYYRRYFRDEETAPDNVQGHIASKCLSMHPNLILQPTVYLSMFYPPDSC